MFTMFLLGRYEHKITQIQNGILRDRSAQKLKYYDKKEKELEGIAT